MAGTAPRRPMRLCAMLPARGEPKSRSVAHRMKRMAESLRMVIADDHPLFRGALREAVSGLFEDVETTDLLTRLTSLTPQQVRVLMMLSEGLLNKQIAYELGVSEATVKAHVSAILQKLGVESRTQAVIAASKIELGQWPQPVGAGH